MVLDSLARIIKVQLPAYLKRLPLPESVGGFLRLTAYLPLYQNRAIIPEAVHRKVLKERRGKVSPESSMVILCA